MAIEFAARLTAKSPSNIARTAISTYGAIEGIPKSTLTLLRLITSLLLFGFLLCTAIQLLLWLGVFSRLAFHQAKPSPPSKGEKPVSVIICARNELENLQQNLHRFLSQSYRSFEIIVVNDHSTDGTLEYLLDIQKKYSNLVIVNLKEATPPGKKAALAKGIRHATHDLLLLTDADCTPQSQYWISQMQAVTTNQKKIGLGYSPYLPDKTPLNFFICFETVFTAVQYFGFALVGLPYMGVGRNLLYHRSIFERAGGFQQHAHIASGDDDLLVNATASKQNTSIVLDPRTFIYSIPKKTWSGYYYQKTRHLTTGSSYKLVHQLVLGLVSASHFGHYVFGLCLFNSPLLLVVLLIYLVRISVVWLLYARILRKLDAQRLLPWIPLLDAAFVLYYILFAPVLITGKQQQWK